MGLFVLLRVHIVMSWITCMQQTQQKVYQLVLIYKKGGNGSWMDTTQMKGAICKNFSLNHWKCTKMTNRKWRLANCSYSRAFSVPCLFVAWIRRGRGGLFLHIAPSQTHSTLTPRPIRCVACWWHSLFSSRLLNHMLHSNNATRVDDLVFETYCKNIDYTITSTLLCIASHCG